MIEQPLSSGRFVEAIRLLTFSVMGVRMGADTEQISEMMGVDAAKQSGAEMVHFHEKISFGKRQIAYHAPKALLIDDGRTPPYTLVIDNPEDIIAVNVQSIEPLPTLIASQRGARAFWGAVSENNSIILLVDFSRIGRGINDPLSV